MKRNCVYKKKSLFIEKKILFNETMRYLPQRLKLTFFKIISLRAAIKGPAEKNTKFQKTLTLAFHSEFVA